MFFRNPDNSVDAFWREYEEKIGEKVLARSLGQYVSGWKEFDSQGWAGIWGLIIATSGGFRFHNFSKTSWLSALTNRTSQEITKERILDIPKEKIISAVFTRETRWWKKILSRSEPMLIIKYLDEAGNELELLLEADNDSGNVADKLSALLQY